MGLERHFAHIKGRGTIDAVMTILDDTWENVTKNKEIHGIAIDLSAAFDTVKHKRIIAYFRRRYGIKGKFLGMMYDYIVNRYTRVRTEGWKGRWSLQKVGMPQGGCLSPIVFIMVYDLVKDIINKNFKYIIYADDLFVWTTLKYYYGNKKQIKNEEEEQKTKEGLEIQIGKIENWIKNEEMRMNMDKTEYMIFYKKKNN